MKNARRHALALLFACSLFAAPALADGIAVVNIQEIMAKSTASKSARDQLEAKQKLFQSEMQRKQEQLTSEDKELGKQRAVMAPDAFDKKVKDFGARATAAQREVQTKRQELNNAMNSALTQIQNAVFDIVARIAKERSYTMVASTSQLLYADPKLDITSEVLTRLNRNLPKVNVTFTSAASGHSEE
jgi:Skp family chaperone for outer membrane proteins